MEIEQQFNIIFEQYAPKIRSISLSYSRKSGVPVVEFISQLNEDLWVAYRKYDSTQSSLNTWLTKRLTDAARRVASRSEYRYHSRITYIDSKEESDEDAPTFEVADETNLEEVILSRLRKKEDDQRQLIVSLIDPAKVDHDTTLIVSQFSQHDSITALAKALGMHHEFVKRKLRKLSRRYDANRFGDINEYLAV